MALQLRGSAVHMGIKSSLRALVMMAGAAPACSWLDSSSLVNMELNFLLGLDRVDQNSH